jgi:hypothetical protein
VKCLANALAALLVATAAQPASAQTPLTVGSVRDRLGNAIAGAEVTGLREGGSPVRGVTDASGTFALEGSGIVAVSVSCRYCAPARAAVTPGQPVVVVVRRYEALLFDAPAPSDLANLPYAHVESAIALRPFTLLAQSSTAYPGDTLSDRGLSPSGSLLVDDGNPAYDLAAGASPYEFIPAHFESGVNVADASQAFRYGNLAGGGTYFADPFGEDGSGNVLTWGSDVIARAQAGSNALGVVAATSSNDEESRQRADVASNLSLGSDQTIAVAAGSEQGRSFDAINPFAGSYSFAGATYRDVRLANLYVNATTDRGNDVFADDYYASQTVWSDAAVSAGVHSNAALSSFADVSLRTTSGLYGSSEYEYALPTIGAYFRQLHADVGLTASGEDYNVTAGVGAFGLRYADGGVPPLKTALALPSLQAQLFPNGHFGGTLEASDSFSLPTFEQQYLDAYYAPSAIELQRDALSAVTLDYTDDSRLHLALEAASQRVAGSADGTITSAGVAATWQFAPLLSLRAWTMHVTDTVPAVYVAGAYTTTPSPTESAAWLTYDSGDALRIDAIYRRDLLDDAPFYHVDGDVSGPIVSQLRWYAGVEDRLRRTFLDVGLRFENQ